MKTFDMCRLMHGEVSVYLLVARVCVFDNGKAVISWEGEHKSIAVYDSFDSLKAVHGHLGTKFEKGNLDLGWDSANQYGAEIEKAAKPFGGMGIHDDATWMCLDWGVKAGKTLLDHMEKNKKCKCELCAAMKANEREKKENE